MTAMKLFGKNCDEIKLHCEKNNLKLRDFVTQEKSIIDDKNNSEGPLFKKI